MRATAWTFAGAMGMQFLAGCVAPGSVAAAEYLAEPIRFIVGYPAGGTTDIAARLIVDKMAASTGRRLIVDNRAGASGIIGAGVVANAAPDAHLLLFAASPEVALARALNRKIDYDPQTGLRPITLVGRVSFVLAVNTSLPVQNLQEFISYARKNRGTDELRVIRRRYL